MDLSKQTPDKKVALCRWYFKVGFALLPFVWAVNIVWFMREAYKKPEYPEQKQLRTYILYSAIGAITWAIGLVSWIIVFQTNRVEWGEFADNISFIIPLGE